MGERGRYTEPNMTIAIIVLLTAAALFVLYLHHSGAAKPKP